MAIRLCAALVALGSMAFRTTRLYSSGLPDQTVQTDGAHRWALATFLLGAIALGLSRWWSRARVRFVVVIGIGCAFGTAAWVSGAYWRQVLVESQRDRDYRLDIAFGLPVVAIAGGLGCGLAIIQLTRIIKAEIGAHGEIR